MFLFKGFLFFFRSMTLFYSYPLDFVITWNIFYLFNDKFRQLCLQNRLYSFTQLLPDLESFDFCRTSNVYIFISTVSLSFPSELISITVHQIPFQQHSCQNPQQSHLLDSLHPTVPKQNKMWHLAFIYSSSLLKAAKRWTEIAPNSD